MASAASSANSTKTAKNNPLGVLVVRFAKGATKRQMSDAVAVAGGEIVTDLSELGRMAVYADSPGLSTRLKQSKIVIAVWTDKFLTHGVIDADPATNPMPGVPQLGNPGPDPIADPWHDLTSFLGESNPRGILQWDDVANGTVGAWAAGVTGDPAVRVAVLDTGVSPSHKELKANLAVVYNTVPCNLLTRQFGPGIGQRDCGSEDTEGHGTWVASRIAGNVNGFASNGIAPFVTVLGYKVLSTPLGGGLTSWIVDGMMRACDNGADVINMSLGGWDNPATDGEDIAMWADAVRYCSHTAIFASAGNDHVRINRVNLTVDGTVYQGIGQADSGNDGYAETFPGDALSNSDLRGLVETPAGIPGVIMVSATNNAIGPVADPQVPANQQWDASLAGTQDQLTYYSNYGSRVDIAAPGGARRYNIPRYSGGPGDILFGGWGELGALTASGEICSDPSLASIFTFACFKVQGSAFGWLQGTSMSSPNAAGVAALTLSAKPGLRGDPAALLARLQGTARKSVANLMGPNDPNNTGNSYTGTPCTTGYCYPQFHNPISSQDAYGAGIVDAAAAVAP
jgi:hypothetical protein